MDVGPVPHPRIDPMPGVEEVRLGPEVILRPRRSRRCRRRCGTPPVGATAPTYLSAVLRKACADPSKARLDAVPSCGMTWAEGRVRTVAQQPSLGRRDIGLPSNGALRRNSNCGDVDEMSVPTSREWNHALGRHFFPILEKPGPVYFSVDDDVLAAIAEHEGWSLAEPAGEAFLRALRADSPSEATASSSIGRCTGVGARSRRPGRLPTVPCNPGRDRLSRGTA